MLSARRAVLAAALLPLLVAGSACGSDAPSSARGGDALADPSTGAAKETEKPVVDESPELSYKVRIEGDFGAEVDRVLPVRVMRVRGGETEAGVVKLLSVGPAEPVALPSGARFRAAFDLVGYEKDGDYTMRAGAPADLGSAARDGKAQKPEDQSNVVVQWWADGDVQRQPQVFNRTIEPCPMQVRAGGEGGEITCDRMTDDLGHHLSLRMSWG